MSMSPNNPFEDPQNDQGYAHDQTPKKKSGKGCLIGCGIAGVLGLVLCCGGGAFFVQFVLGALGEELARQVGGNPAVVEHIGEIESMNVSLSATIEEAQKSGEQNAGLIYEIKGSKGSGKLLVKDQGGEGLESVTLILSDGTRIPIELGAGGPEIEEMDFELEDMIDTGDIDTGETESIEIAVPDVPVELEKRPIEN
jgi:hypothetical protein